MLAQLLPNEEVERDALHSWMQAAEDSYNVHSGFRTFYFVSKYLNFLPFSISPCVCVCVGGYSFVSWLDFSSARFHTVFISRIEFLFATQINKRRQDATFTGGFKHPVHRSLG